MQAMTTLPRKRGALLRFARDTTKSTLISSRRGRPNHAHSSECLRFAGAGRGERKSCCFDDFAADACLCDPFHDAAGGVVDEDEQRAKEALGGVRSTASRKDAVASLAGFALKEHDRRERSIDIGAAGRGQRACASCGPLRGGPIDPGGQGSPFERKRHDEIERTDQRHAPRGSARRSFHGSPVAPGRTRSTTCARTAASIGSNVHSGWKQKEN
jgi:hypothetical protein